MGDAVQYRQWRPDTIFEERRLDGEARNIDITPKHRL
jgi:hypothetical protein